MTILERILASTRDELARREAAVPEVLLAARVEAHEPRAPGGFARALVGPEIAVIAEHKRRSPSAGLLTEVVASPGQVALEYERGGAAAISVLTEPAHFAGSLTDLEQVRRATALPVLRKDFIVSRYQLLESVLTGADAVLLIVAALDDATLKQLHGFALELGLAPLVEVHDADELTRALDAVDPAIIGINNRSLADFSVDWQRTLELVPHAPEKIIVSESGIGTAEQVHDLWLAGVDAVLVGGSLMSAPDRAAAVRTLLSASSGLEVT